MTLQAMPKQESRSDNKDDVFEESLSDDITGTEIHGDNEKEEKLTSALTVRKQSTIMQFYESESHVRSASGNKNEFNTNPKP